jgi:hypothetical protein
MTINHYVIITSAINTDHGAFDPDTRLVQTLNTIQSVYDTIPGAKVALVESSGKPMEKNIIDKLHKVTNCVIDMSSDPTLKYIHDNTENWDLVKNLCEMLAFNSALKMLHENGQFEGIDRIHKLSGRYVVNEDFKLEIYEENPDKIIVPQRIKTQFPKKVGQRYQYMSRLWSWPASMLPEIQTFYKDSIEHYKKRYEENVYIDIEHLMFKLLPKKHVHEVPLVGVHGRLAQTKEFVRN